MWGNEAERASFRVENSGRPPESDGLSRPMRRSGDTLAIFVSGAAEIMRLRASATVDHVCTNVPVLCTGLNRS